MINENITEFQVQITRPYTTGKITDTVYSITSPRGQKIIAARGFQDPISFNLAMKELYRFIYLTYSDGGSILGVHPEYGLIWTPDPGWEPGDHCLAFPWLMLHERSGKLHQGVANWFMQAIPDPKYRPN